MNRILELAGLNEAYQPLPKGKIPTVVKVAASNGVFKSLIKSGLMTEEGVQDMFLAVYEQGYEDGQKVTK